MHLEPDEMQRSTKMHQTDAVSIKVSDGQLKDEHRISATISSCLMGPGADQPALAVHQQMVFWQEIAIVLHIWRKHEEARDRQADFRLMRLL